MHTHAFLVFSTIRVSSRSSCRRGIHSSALSNSPTLPLVLCLLTVVQSKSGRQRCPGHGLQLIIYPTNYHYDQVNQVLNKYSTRVMRLATSNQQPATILTLVMKSHSDKGAFGRNRLISLVAGHAGRKKQGTISLSANSWSQLNCGHHLREAEHNSAR